MKISFALGPRRPLSRETAWGCLTSNVALPGIGSLVAGRISGYPQVALALGGMGLTLVFGLRFFAWFAANHARLYGPDGNGLDALLEVVRAVRWAFLGIALFALGWLWALATSLGLLREAKKPPSPNLPPRLT
jgi:hypothetical protein